MATLYEQLRLLQGLISRRVAFAGPFGITVDVTRRCNLQCVGCLAHSPHVNGRKPYDPAVQDLDVEMFERLCHDLRTMNTHTLVFCGDGEPLLHPRLPELLETARDAKFRTVLLTNGTLLDRARAGLLVDSRLDLVRVSLWAVSPDEFRLNCPGSHEDLFAKIVDGIRLLVSAKASQKRKYPKVGLHYVINRHNFRSIGSFVDLALDMRCDSVSFSPLHTIFGQVASYGITQQEEGWLRTELLRAEEKLRWAGLENNIDETVRRYEIGEEVRREVPCYVGWLHCRMKVDGTVQPCNPCRWPVGNFREQSFHEIWNSPAYRSFREKILAPEAPREMDQCCDCSFCCYLSENLRVHRFFKWLSPLSCLAEKQKRI